ncbi:MAG: response regulator [Pleurocapsa sp. MO_226.B13]|nr:response regulator [Pleurocapsa sp. MO_226.B13]
MPSQKYESGQLNSILNSLFKKGANGVLCLETQVASWVQQRSCLLILRNGALTYGEKNVSTIPTNRDLCQMLGDKLKPNLINAALSVALEKITNPSSTRELTELLIRMRVFSWQEIEALIATQVVLILERFLSHPGIAHWQISDEFDLSYGEDKHGLDRSQIEEQLKLRQQKWQQYAPTIPSMDAIPYVTPEQLQQIGDRNVKQHLAGSVDGKHTLIDIADKMGKDPLKVAKSYVNWANNGWVSIGTTPRNDRAVSNAKAKIQLIQDAIKSNDNAPKSASINNSVNQTPDNQNLPIVLSVDDSPIIQTTIKRALKEQYNVLLADKAADALKILHQHPVRLMLLDLTMPDVDGLEFCKIVRQIDKFRDLPIVMVTARDGLVNKMKGHIAGTSKYLTKPFKPEELRAVVAEYLKS